MYEFGNYFGNQFGKGNQKNRFGDVEGIQSDDTKDLFESHVDHLTEIDKNEIFSTNY